MIEDAFGAQGAKAVSTLGTALEQTGDRLFTRAVALQQLNNETEARDADTQYMIQAGKLHADFSTLEGKAASDAYPKFQADLEAIRTSIRNGLSNPMAQKLFDSNSLSTMGRTIFNGAGHAASENKKWINGSLTAQHMAYVDSVISNPDNSTLFAGALANAASTANQKADNLGLPADDPTRALMVKQQQSTVWSAKIDGLARQEPATAKQLLEAALEKHYILGQDYEKLSPKVDVQLQNVTARNISDAVRGGWAPYMTAPQIARANGVEQSLVSVIQRAQQNHPELKFGIGAEGGRRTEADQARLYAQGRTAPGPIVTWTMNSNHLTGRATDVVPLDKNTSQDAITSAMREAAGQLGVRLGDPIKGDANHYELAKDYNVADFKAPGKPSEDKMSGWAEDYAKGQYPTDAKMGFAVRDRVRTDYQRERADERSQQAQTYGSLASFVVDNGVTSKDVILNSPQVSEAYGLLDGTHKTRIDNLIRAQARQPTQETPEKAAFTQQLLNLSTQLGGKRDQFMELDPAQLMLDGKISTAGMKAIYTKQRQIQDGQANDARHLQHAISISRSYMKAASITSGSDQELQFIGALNGWMQDYENQKKAAPSDQEIRDKAAELTTYSGGFLGIGGAYGFEPPSAFVNEITPLFQSRYNGKAPSTEQIARMYQYSLTHPKWREELQ